MSKFVALKGVNKMWRRFLIFILALGAILAVLLAFRHADVIGAAGHFLSRWWLILIALLLAGAAIGLWRYGGALSNFRWNTELTVAMIAALAVVVGGAVTAWSSSHTASMTLMEQRDLATDTYVRDNRKTLYFNVIENANSLGSAIDPIPRAALAIKDGKASQIPQALQDNLKKKRDDFQWGNTTMVALAPNDTIQTANALAAESSRILDAVIELNITAEDRRDAQTVQAMANALMNYIVDDQTWRNTMAQLLTLMRRDLGLSDTYIEVPKQ